MKKEREAEEVIWAIASTACAEEKFPIIAELLGCGRPTVHFSSLNPETRCRAQMALTVNLI